MSQTVADLPTFLRHADRGLKDAVLSALLAERMAAQPGQPLDVPGVGVVMPFAPFGGTPPDLTPEEEAEIAAALASHPDDTLTLDEILADLADPPAAPAGGPPR